MVYTPRAVATALADAALDGSADVPRTWEPAVGTGALALAWAEAAWRQARAHTPRDRLALLRERLTAQDVDADAVAVCRAVLAEAAGAPSASLQAVVQVADSLGAPLQTHELVIANPPWVSSAAMDPARRAALAQTHTHARGNWDLWCLFVERAWAAAPRVALLLPDKLLAAPFAASARQALARRVVSITELEEAFEGAAVRSVAVVADRAHEGPAQWHQTGSEALCTRLDPSGHAWARPDPAGALEALQGLPTLGTIADVHGAATVAEAYAWKPHLRDTPEPGADDACVINSGTIDPWRSLWGHKPMRYLGARWTWPSLPAEVLSDRRRQHWRGAKLIVAGMTRSLEAVPDPGGHWLGAKSTTLVRPHDPQAVLRLALWLHSPWVDHWYRHTFAGLGFRGGYLRVGPPQLRGVPVPPDAAWPADLTQALPLDAQPSPARREAIHRALAQVVGPPPPPSTSR